MEKSKFDKSGTDELEFRRDDDTFRRTNDNKRKKERMNRVLDAIHMQEWHIIADINRNRNRNIKLHMFM